MNNKFPFRIITEEQRDKSFNDLKNSNELKLSRKYNLCSDFYFQEYRLRTRKGKYSAVEAYENNKEKVYNILRNKNIEINDVNVRRICKLWFGCVGQFRPDVAVYFYKKYGATSVMDPFAGWGDRCIAAISQGIKYTGIDSNTSLKVPYKNMIDHFGSNNVEIIYNNSENIDPQNYEYDMIFTSPPYFSIEKYEGMKQYSKEEFISAFELIISNFWKYLPSGKWMILNMPQEMADITNRAVGNYTLIEKMPISNRNYKDTSKKFENIYLYKKE